MSRGTSLGGDLILGRKWQCRRYGCCLYNPHI